MWDKESDGRNFVTSYSLPYPVGRDSTGSIGISYDLQDTTPVSVFIGKDGVMVERIRGEIDQADFAQRIAKLLAS